MSASLNLVVLIGNLTADPELQYTQSGVARTNFRIAINRQYRDSNDELQEETDFIPIVVWRNQAENCATYLSKGRSVAVTGRLRRRSWENDDGETQWFTEVVARNVQFLSGRPSESSQQDTGNYDSSQSSKESQQTGSSEEDDNIPF